MKITVPLRSRVAMLTYRPFPVGGWPGRRSPWYHAASFWIDRDCRWYRSCCKALARKGALDDPADESRGTRVPFALAARQRPGRGGTTLHQLGRQMAAIQHAIGLGAPVGVGGSSRRR